MEQIIHTFKTSLISLALGFILHLFQGLVGSSYLSVFLYENLITLLVSLLAINSATMGIVLTKIRDIVDSEGNASCFLNTRKSMVHSVKEQIVLVAAAIVILVLADGECLNTVKNFNMLVQSCKIGVFVYALMILYDTAKGVLIIVDFDPGDS